MHAYTVYPESCGQIQLIIFEGKQICLSNLRLLSYQVRTEVEAGSLQVLMPQYEPPGYPVHILHRESRHASARVRAFIDLLAQRLRGERSLNDPAL
jgi:hypothetical protein